MTDTTNPTAKYSKNYSGDVGETPKSMAGTWHKGPPPFPGWWNASWNFNDGIWRWWNGRYWSKAVVSCSPVASVRCAARRHEQLQDTLQIKWTDYWPENARVPRVDPRSKT